MGIAERKEREKKQRRESIIEAGKKIIRKDGVEGMSMNRLAESTELNKATLYLYFKNKDDLVDAIVYEGLLILEERFKEVDVQNLSGIEKVLNFIKALFSFYKKYPVYFYALNHKERRTVGERLETPFAVKGDEAASRLFAEIAGGLREGIEAGSVRKEINVDETILLIFAHTYGVMHTIHSKEDVYKDVLNLAPECIERSAIDLIEYYLRK